MLDISKINDHVPEKMRALIGELRRGHTSPVTIHVEMQAGTHRVLSFYDERFPSTVEESPRIAVLRYEEGNFILRSHRIRNKKFSPGNGGYRERLTNDPRKMLKWLREYVTPLTYHEIMQTTDDVTSAYGNWATEPERNIRDAVPAAMSRNFLMILMEEMSHMQRVGFTQFATDHFRKIYQEALPMYDEHVRRSSLNVKHVHVYIEPDGKVIATSKDDATAVYDSAKYENMEQAPKIIQEQVAMLKLAGKGNYLPEVGQCMTDNIYWLHVFEPS